MEEGEKLVQTALENFGRIGVYHITCTCLAMKYTISTQLQLFVGLHVSFVEKAYSTYKLKIPFRFRKVTKI